MKYTGPKARLSRRLGVALTPKAARILERKGYPPGQHGQVKMGGRRPKISDYSRQLTEKQKLRAQYNIHERQMLNDYGKAIKMKGNSAENLVGLLESRLDALVLRAGFAPTIYAARQVVNHGHVQVNGLRVNIPSYQVKPGDVITVAEKSRRMPMMQEARENRGGSAPAYLAVEMDAMRVTYTRLPKREEVPIICEVPSVVEFYSR
jgi:small subunit ribosomal protein S4